MMQELFAQPYFGVLLTIAAYWAGMKIQHKTRLAICNGMLLAVLLVIAVLLVFHIPYESYYQGGALINLFLGPATACMAVTIYSQRRLLAKHWLPVLVGCTVGVVTAMGSILLLCRLFGLDRAMTMSLLPKSVTMPIATVVSQGHGGTTAGHAGEPVRTAAGEAVPGKGPHSRGPGHRGVQPRHGHGQGPGAGRDRGSHERPGHRPVRDPYHGAGAVRRVFCGITIIQSGSAQRPRFLLP